VIKKKTKVVKEYGGKESYPSAKAMKMHEKGEGKMVEMAEKMGKFGPPPAFMKKMMAAKMAKKKK